MALWGTGWIARATETSRRWRRKGGVVSMMYVRSPISLHVAARPVLYEAM